MTAMRLSISIKLPVCPNFLGEAWRSGCMSSRCIKFELCVSAAAWTNTSYIRNRQSTKVRHSWTRSYAIAKGMTGLPETAQCLQDGLRRRLFGGFVLNTAWLILCVLSFSSGLEELRCAWITGSHKASRAHQGPSPSSQGRRNRQNCETMTAG